jgi:nucleotide-binding universal stress UspA family protein
MTAGQDGAPRIVVGVDGSPSSLAALRWALRQARLTGGRVDAIIAWNFPVVPGAGWVPASVGDDIDFRQLAEKTLNDAVDGVVGATGAGDVPVQRLVVAGAAAEVLLSAAKGAALLVVGSRGHGGFADALLGSVSQHCVRHARCPVMIMRGEHRGQTLPPEVRG